MTQQPDPIEIKVNVAGKVDDALAALGLDEGAPREVWFLDDLTEGARPPLPLLSNGIILRVRRRKKKEDSTVKLRPCRRSQLVSRWDARPAEDSDYRIEGTGRGNVMSLPRRAWPTFNRAPLTVRSKTAGMWRTCSVNLNAPSCQRVGLSASRSVESVSWGPLLPDNGRSSPSAVSITLRPSAGRPPERIFWNCRSVS